MSAASDPIAKVEPLTTARALRGPFDYRLGPDFAGVEVGSLLVVPFGRRRVLGVVVEMAKSSQLAPERLAAPLEALEHGVPIELVRLAQWIAEAYCSTPARALGLVLAPGTGRRVPIKARRVAVALLTPAGARALVDGERLGTNQRAALTALRGADGPLPVAALSGGSAGMRRLHARGFVTVGQAEVSRRPACRRVGARLAQIPVLTDEQRDALAPIVSAIEGGPGEREFLLHGVTGSGKTEVYLQAAAAALAAGRGAIVLVPEIGLTPQTVGRFADRFGDTVAVLHSQLGAGERHDEWRRLRRGEARICVGPRSAVFAPVKDLGLIVVDEEHDSSYKNEGDPRYDARAVAARRAVDAGAVLIAGSATPRPESVRALKRLTMARRVDGRGLPPVTVLDMRGVSHALHPSSAEALADVRRAGHKAIVLLNRRGWSNFLSCRSCGHVWECPECDVALVLHRSARQVSCHHCGHHEPVPATCATCGSVSVARHGAGTEWLEHELEAALGEPGFPIFRLDSDVAGAKNSIGDVLEAFESAASGVLLGTQMVAKGHDFPDVTLGVVLDADSTLRFPDFRAEERTFALVAQLAGRAGRGPGGGRVLVQTLAPEAPSIRRAAKHDSQGFLEDELGRREALSYPPFSELIRIVCSSTRSGAAMEAARAVRGAITIEDASVLGPATLFRLRGRERAQVVVKASVREAAVRAVGAAVAQIAADREHRECSFSVDVDPQ